MHSVTDSWHHWSCTYLQRYCGGWVYVGPLRGKLPEPRMRRSMRCVYCAHKQRIASSMSSSKNFNECVITEDFSVECIDCNYFVYRDSIWKKCTYEANTFSAWNLHPHLNVERSVTAWMSVNSCHLSRITSHSCNWKIRDIRIIFHTLPVSLCSAQEFHQNKCCKTQ